MSKTLVKRTLKPVLKPVVLKAHQLYKAYQTFPVPIDKLLRGGENGIRAACYAELTGDFLRPSTSVLEGPHVKLLQQYDQMGESVLQDEIFTTTPYYQNAYRCIALTGSYFYDRPADIKTLAERFIQQYRGTTLNLPPQPGQSDTNAPIWVRPIKHSTCFEVIDGNHRIARAIMRGDKTIPAYLYDSEAVFTPLQQLLLDCLWINKKRWLYQPVDAPELKDNWVLIRKCSDRLAMMQNFLKQSPLISHNDTQSTYIDIGSSYGWFVKEMGAFGLKAYGMERDPLGMKIGFHVYGLKPEQIIHKDVILGLEDAVRAHKKYDVVSCLSVLHHFALNKNSSSAETLIQLLDKITAKVLFLDTGEEHEEAFGGTLAGWNRAFIADWLKRNTSFAHIIPLGTDTDRRKPFQYYYGRTLFACVR